MKRITLKLQESILRETESLLQHLKTRRNKYFNMAVEFYNKYQKRMLIEEQLSKEFKLVAQNSMELLGEFEDFENEN